MGLTRREAAALDRWIMNPPELEDEDREPNEDCARPGRHGCGSCDACSDWGDAEYHRLKEEEAE